MTKPFIDTTTVAKMIRKDLKEAFKGVKFSVKSDKYSGGSSINISYTDGPTVDEVKNIVAKYEGADFDGMQDLKTNKDIIIDGVAYLGGPDFIFVNRDYSKEFTENVLMEKFGYGLESVKYHEAIKDGCVSVDGLEHRNERQTIANTSGM